MKKKIHFNSRVCFWQSETVVQTKLRHFIMFHATKYARIFGVL